MATFLFSEHVFGPVKSRRLGSSLGINLLSVNQKVCNFNCIYCECGLTHKLTKEKSVFVDKTYLLETLRAKLLDCKKNKTRIDTITFAGNGEPTMHPDFSSIVDEIVNMRNDLIPKAKIAVLTNGVTLNKPVIREALKKVDKAIIKLDAGNDETLKLIDHPKGALSVEKLLDNIKSFEGETIIQTMFLRGLINNQVIDNSSGKDLTDWLRKIKIIAPKEVMLYSLDRDTPISNLYRVTKEELKKIADHVNDLGIKTQVV